MIAQKKDIVGKVLAALGKKEIVHAGGVPICSMIYDNYMPQIAGILSPKERDSVHVIYEQLKG